MPKLSKIKFESLILKYINQTSSSSELKVLIKALEDIKNVRVFKEYIKTNYYSIYVMNQFETEDIISEIKKRIHRTQKKEKGAVFFKKTLKYAALIVLMFSLGYYSHLNSIGYGVEVQKITPKADDIVLSAEGNDFIIQKDEYKNQSEKKLVSKINLVQKSNQLIYDNDIKVEKISFHSLKVPYGKRFNIIFSDGSKVYLNSGSSIKYPIKFIPNQVREVFLEGEAFFDVTENKSDLFIVNSNGINIEVYGTRFNVRNYPEDYNSDIVLVQGSVGITNSKNDDVTKLTPGFKGSVNKENLKIEKSKINTKIYTSWIDGEFIFRNESFSQILRKLERLYNVTIIDNREKKSKELFNAAIDVENEKIEEVLNYFNKIYNIEYQIFNNKIIIN
tara:strand:- start:3142 stop:4311 length:1170 start_codon:yes stop_codon:yes gene_type:complete